MPHPKIRLSQLRDIGWKLWDPIGLLNAGSDWRDCGFADEYDTYLMQAAVMVRNAEPFEKIIVYLMETETDTIGLSSSPDSRSRAETMVRALQNSTDIWSD